MPLFFRIRENGASVFRIDTENRQKRLDLQPLARINLRSGEVSAQKDAILSPEETAEIDAWIKARRQRLRRDAAEAPARTMEQMNLLVAWLSNADDEEVEACFENLLFTIHDLRTALVRRKARMLPTNGENDAE